MIYITGQEKILVRLVLSFLFQLCVKYQRDENSCIALVVCILRSFISWNKQDEAGTAAIKTVELDAALGGRAVQYREVQGHETEKFLSYFKPCIIPQQGGTSSGFKHVEAEEHQIRLYVCKGKHVVHVKEASGYAMLLLMFHVTLI